MNIRHDKDKVLDTGLNLFCTKGYNSLGIDEICKLTGMTKGAFYNAFKSKENFLLQAIDVYGLKNVVRIKARLDSNAGGTAIERLRMFYLEMLMYQPGHNFMGCMINNMMSELGAASKKVGAATTVEFEKFILAIAPCVKEAQEAGEITSNLKPEEVAELLHSTFYGILTRSKSLGSVKEGIDSMNILFNLLK